MFNNLPNTAVQEASEEDVLAAMGVEEVTKGKTGKTDNKAKDTKPSEKSKTSDSATAGKTTVTDADEDDFETAFRKEDDDDDTGKKGKKKDTKKVETKKADEDEEDEDEEDTDDEDKDDEDEDEDENDTKKKDDEDDDESVAISDFLKARAKLLVNKGEWSDFKKDDKTIDELEWTEELFEEVELEQRAAFKQGIREELLDAFGPYGRSIAQYSENGGNPDDLIDIFVQEQEIKAIDISTEDGQKEMVYEYLTKVIGRSPQKANKDIERFIADKELEDEAKEAESKMKASLKAEREALEREQEDAKKNADSKEKAAQAKFTSDVNEYLTKNEDIPEEERKQIIKVLTTFKHELGNGKKVNDFYFKLAEFRKSLPNYIEMVRLVLNPEKFKKSLKNEGKTKAAEKAFKLARTSGTKRKASMNNDENTRQPKKSATGFKLL